MEIVFYTSVTLILYTYFGYPLLLKLILLIFDKPVVKDMVYQPSITLIISAYNEEKQIKKKIENTLKFTYPKNKLQIIVVSDSSTDNTDKIICNYIKYGVEYIRTRCRQGKTFAQNFGLKIARNEVIVFTDVSTTVENNALELLAANFNDPTIGLVSAVDFWYDSDAKGISSKGQGSYVKYEMFVRKLESNIYTTINASGCFYGVRKIYVDYIDQEQIDDISVPLNVIRHQKRVIIDNNIIARVPKTIGHEKEFNRRTRIVVGGLFTFFRNLDLLNPFKYKFVSIQMISHKLLKWTAPLFLFLILFTNTFLVTKSFLYLNIILLQFIFYLFALIGFKLRYSNCNIWLFNIPFFFCSSNLSIIVGWIRYIKGKNYITWEPSRH